MGSRNNGLMETIHVLHNTGKYSDLRVTHGSQMHKVHQNIVCPQSGWFEKECEGIEADSVAVNLNDRASLRLTGSANHIAAFQAMIEFFYGRTDYHLHFNEKTCDLPQFLAHLYDVAEQFDAPIFRDDVVRKFKASVTKENIHDPVIFANVLEYLYDIETEAEDLGSMKERMLHFALHHRGKYLDGHAVATLLQYKPNIAVDMVAHINKCHPFGKFLDPYDPSARKVSPAMSPQSNKDTATSDAHKTARSPSPSPLGIRPRHSASVLNGNQQSLPEFKNIFPNHNATKAG
ncbi:hypothetical protein K461DRAFT_294605 [Myriangium duriaei CBS 260.36]|uniref:BTB domain-containing protein n=1 Tax=Myriangium duriaei CBS 260.36 TaxID=1168546 RepID=A0A9P4MJ43_9PEZI|nr:hypothetical protein K461DRAFT_294605 [Myriangium duriaei CBS 260.36]